MTNPLQGKLTNVTAGGKSLEVLVYESPSARQTIVLVHEALGSVSYWKTFPEKLTTATGCHVIAYSRAGHGHSEGPVNARSLEYYTEQVEQVLPAILQRFGIAKPVLYGHSEGAAIALLYAAQHPEQVAAVIAEAPIVTQEKQARERIRELSAIYESSELQRKLARYHRDADAVFHSWAANINKPLLQGFPLHQYLRKITCPVLALQGSQDEFGGAAQLTALQRYIPQAQCEVIPNAGHLLHREQIDLVIERVSAFLA